MNFNIKFTDEAALDFKESAEWYEEQQESLSDRFIFEVEEKILLITQKPEIYPKTIGLKQEAVLQTFPFVIVFRVIKSKNTVFILAIFHTSRNPKQKLRRKFKA